MMTHHTWLIDILPFTIGLFTTCDPSKLIQTLQLWHLVVFLDSLLPCSITTNHEFSVNDDHSRVYFKSENGSEILVFDFVWLWVYFDELFACQCYIDKIIWTRKIIHSMNSILFICSMKIMSHKIWIMSYES